MEHFHLALGDDRSSDLLGYTVNYKYYCHMLLFVMHNMTVGRENRSRRRVIRKLGNADSIKLIYISASDDVNKDGGETGDVQ